MWKVEGEEFGKGTGRHWSAPVLEDYSVWAKGETKSSNRRAIVS